jgi:hypothetical protein
VKASFVEDIPYFQRGSLKCIESGPCNVVLLVKSFQRHNATATYLKFVSDYVTKHMNSFPAAQT